MDAEQALAFLDKPSRSGEVKFAIREARCRCNRKATTSRAAKQDSVKHKRCVLPPYSVQIDIERWFTRKTDTSLLLREDINDITKPMLGTVRT